MINLAISLGVATLLVVLATLIQVHLLISVPLALLVGFGLFIFLGRKVQVELEAIMRMMQRELQANKMDRAIEVLKQGYALKNRHLFVESQLNSQIGMLYYLKKDWEKAQEYLKHSFVRNFAAQCMLAAIHHRNKDYEACDKVMETTIQANKKESFVYSLHAYFLMQRKERDKAIAVLQKGLKATSNDDRINSNLILIQNNKKMKMKVYGDLWVQMMLERPPRMQQAGHPHQRVSKKAMFR